MAHRPLVLAIAASCLAAGCSAEYWTGRIKPETWLKFNPVSRTIEFYDSKENTIRINDLEVNGDTKSMKVASVEVLNLSQPVIDADAARMQYVIEAQRVQIEYQRQIGQNIAMAIAAGGDAAAKFISVLPKIEWPGGSVTPAPCPVAEVLDDAADGAAPDD